MNYKGYNIAIHEFGHNVEQTLSLYDVDYYMLSGVPNTAFTEALAFVFQKRDLEILDITDPNPEKQAMEILDKVWSMYEILRCFHVGYFRMEMDVCPSGRNGRTAERSDDRIIERDMEQILCACFRSKDETVLAVYSHMISYPLYLSAYAFGQIIEFQLDQYLEGKNFANEVERIFRQGRLTPNQWMILATGSPLTVEPMLEAVRQVIK